MTDNIQVGRLFPNSALPVSKHRTNPTMLGTSQQSFQQILQDKVVRLSHHAELRLQQRGIKLEADQMAKIESAIDKAASKGAKDSLILFRDMAFIVNVKNRTIVTAMEGSSMKDNVFTQIDSAIIIA